MTFEEALTASLKPWHERTIDFSIEPAGFRCRIKPSRKCGQRWISIGIDVTGESLSQALTKALEKEAAYFAISEKDLNRMYPDSLPDGRGD